MLSPRVRVALPRRVERLVLLHSTLNERCSNHHRRNFASRHGVLLKVSAALHLRDHCFAQDQMFKGCAERVALLFSVRIHIVVALPSVMVKVVFQLEVSVEGWLIAERTVALCGRSEVWSCGTGTDVDVRHDAFQRESPRRNIASYATTPNYMIAFAASSTQVRGMRRHVIPRCGRAFLHSRDTAETTL